MTKHTLTLGEIYVLDSELNGQKNPQSGEVLTKGLISHPISLLQKYWLHDLSDSIQQYKKNVDTLRNELINKYGEKGDNDSITIPMSVDKVDENGNLVKDAEDNVIKVINPKFLEFNAEMETLLAETRDIEHYPFRIENFDFKTDEDYKVFYKILRPTKETESAN